MSNTKKWIHGALPAFLMHLSAGTIYAFSLFVKPLSQHMGFSELQIQFAFSLAIFFLGMSAAFGGSLVEKNIEKATHIGLIGFIGGLILTAIAIQCKSLLYLYLGYGVLHGIGLGFLYLTPCKIVMLHFKENKGMAIGLSIMGFGFASTFASPLITNLLTYNPNHLGMIFVDLTMIYAIPLIIAKLLLKKPDDYDLYVINKNDFKYKELFKNKIFWAIWLMLFINIHCGLALISIASPMLIELGADPVLIALIIAVMGLCNGGGRLIFSTISDHLSHRIFIYLLLFSLSIISVYSYIILPNIFTMGLMLCGISAFFGGGFSNIAPMVADKFGLSNVSKIHGVVLSSWAIAGLTGNSMSLFIHNITGSYELIYSVLGVLYTLGLLCVIYLCINYNKVE
jgi:OFA family oxalate/formate antiporter-like MFS transporter